MGDATDAVADGGRALDALREGVSSGQPYDLALLDLCMPRMDGLDLARQISADVLLGATGLLLLTSSPDVTPQQVAAAGITESLTKPVRLSQLHAALQTVRSRARTPAAQTPTATAVLTGKTRGHVLVVEDNTTNQLVAVGILGGLGFTVEVAGNGLEALMALARTSFAAVFMDCNMPVMDGYTATAQIRRDEGAARHTPIIAMTAGAIQGDREHCLASGMDDYVSKPVTPQLLESALARWIDAAHD